MSGYAKKQGETSEGNVRGSVRREMSYTLNLDVDLDHHCSLI